MPTTRSDLEKMYRAAFGCEWNLAPWGKPWPDVLSEGKEADREFIHSKALLDNFVNAVNALEAHAIACGLTPGADWDAERAGPRTAPELSVLLLVSKEGEKLIQGRDLARDLVSMFESKTEHVYAGGESNWKASVAAMFDSLGKLVDAGPDPAHLAHVRALYNTHATRRLKPMTMRVPWGGEPFPVGRGTLMTEPPARAVKGARARERFKDDLHVAEWRRVYLVQLLDVYPIRTSQVRGGIEYPSDTEIAIVSLLCGLDAVLTVAWIRRNPIVTRETSCSRTTPQMPPVS